MRKEVSCANDSIDDSARVRVAHFGRPGALTTRLGGPILHTEWHSQIDTLPGNTTWHGTRKARRPSKRKQRGHQRQARSRQQNSTQAERRASMRRKQAASSEATRKHLHSSILKAWLSELLFRTPANMLGAERSQARVSASFQAGSTVFGGWAYGGPELRSPRRSQARGPAPRLEEAQAPAPFRVSIRVRRRLVAHHKATQSL